MKTFIVLLPNGKAINEKTKINGNVIESEMDLWKFLKAHFLSDNKVKSFQQYADELNESGEYESEFTELDGLDVLNSTYSLNIDNKHITIYKLKEIYLHNLKLKQL